MGSAGSFLDSIRICFENRFSIGGGDGNLLAVFPRSVNLLLEYYSRGLSITPFPVELLLLLPDGRLRALAARADARALEGEQSHLRAWGDDRI